MKDIGQIVASAWDEVLQSATPLTSDADFWTRKPTPLTVAERAELDAETASWCAELAARTAAKREQFKGAVVAVEDYYGDDVLVYSDGRRLRLISEWYEWEHDVK